MFSATEKRVLKRLTPPKRLPAIILATIRKVEAEIRRRQLLATVVLGGSMAKGTYLAGDHDADVFVRFSPEYDDRELADRLEQVIRAVFKRYERVHGSRDYFHVYAGSYLFEFIPVLNIGSWAEARNVTDMSPLHVQYVAQKIGEKPELSASIRLTKQFCKAAKIYGAESYIGGLSGHVIDLLNIYYGGFHELLQAAAAWPAKVVIDPERHLDNPLSQLNDSKVYAPLVIVDPVQQDRNSAAAVTEAAFKRFKAKAQEYLAAKDKERFFTITPLSAATFKKAHPQARIIQVKLAPQRGKKDVVGAKCFKVYQYLSERLLEHGFSLIDSKWEFTPKQALLLFALPAQRLPAHQELGGPPVHRTADVVRFKDAHKMTFSRDGRIYALERRKYRDAQKLVNDLLKTPYVKERVKG
jgi:tRNA nucleotidyltransferase (CCA-adding enzyme)